MDSLGNAISAFPPPRLLGHDSILFQHLTLGKMISTLLYIFGPLKLSTVGLCLQRAHPCLEPQKADHILHCSEAVHIVEELVMGDKLLDRILAEGRQESQKFPFL